MIEGKWFAPGEDFAEAEAIRRAVLGSGRDETDLMAWNVVVRQDGAAAAAGRLWWQDGAFWLGEIAVLESHRGCRLGDLVLRLLLFKAQSHAARIVRLRCPEELCPFFARLGLREEGREGDLVLMSARGEDVCLDSCKGCQKDCPTRK